MIKRYNQFIKENIQAEEEHNVSDEDMETIRRGDEENGDDLFQGEETIEGDLPFTEEEIEREAAEEENDGSVEDQMEEEGGEYIGQKMMQELSDKLDCPIDADGSINCHGKKINFYSETEMFHVDREKFATAEEVVDYVEGSEGSEEPIQNNELESQREREDEEALLANKGEFGDEESKEELEREMEEEYESKSYKKKRKFRRYLK